MGSVEQQMVVWFLRSLGVSGIIAHLLLVLVTWRHRKNAVFSGLFYYAAFQCASSFPMELLVRHSQHPTAFKIYFFLYWLSEPVSDFLLLFIGYQLLVHLCDSMGQRRVAVWLLQISAIIVVLLTLWLMFGSFLSPYISPRYGKLLIAKCCLGLAQCALVLVLVVFKRSFGASPERPMILITLGLGVEAACTLISTTLFTFWPYSSRVGKFSLFGAIEAMGVITAAIIWFLTVLKMPESAIVIERPDFSLSLNRLNSASTLLAEIMKR